MTVSALDAWVARGLPRLDALDALGFADAADVERRAIVERLAAHAPASRWSESRARWLHRWLAIVVQSCYRDSNNGGDWCGVLVDGRLRARAETSVAAAYGGAAANDRRPRAVHLRSVRRYDNVGTVVCMRKGR